MDFIIRLPVSVKWKCNSYDSILVIVIWPTKMGLYKPGKVTIDAAGLAKIIIDVVVCHHGLLDSIVTHKGSFFTSKFWSSPYYFLGIKQKLSTIFHPQTNSQTKRQNSTMEAYLRVFVYFEQNDQVRLLLRVEFAYNNAKNASTSHTLFELNCGYHLYVFYKKDVNPHSKLKLADKLLSEL